MFHHLTPSLIAALPEMDIPTSPGGAQVDDLEIFIQDFSLITTQNLVAVCHSVRAYVLCRRRRAKNLGALTTGAPYLGIAIVHDI